MVVRDREDTRTKVTADHERLERGEDRRVSTAPAGEGDEGPLIHLSSDGPSSAIQNHKWAASKRNELT